MSLHIHLDLVGGIAGDMFLSAITDAHPELSEGLLGMFQALDLPGGVTYRFMERNDGVFRGRGFVSDEPHDPGEHTHFPQLCNRIRNCQISDVVASRAITIFTLLAEAESRVHGVPLEKVNFHEVGAWDSVIDIVGAAYLIEMLDSTWSCGAVPLGGGYVRTAHGSLPIPAPATSVLLEGFECLDDGLSGERVTPTGAAILRHLRGYEGSAAVRGKLLFSGIGFGTSKLAGKSNILRALVFDTGRGKTQDDKVGIVEFEVDDQPPEELAYALDLVREKVGVLDVVQWPFFGKKNRIGVHVQILCLPECLNDVQNACLLETCTIGLRWRTEERRVLPRRIVTVKEGGEDIRVKVVDLPEGGISVKAEHEDVRRVTGGKEKRQAVKLGAEKKAREHND
jgi:uncharacterized protein (TIGR00299 family) protein